MAFRMTELEVPLGERRVSGTSSVTSMTRFCTFSLFSVSMSSRVRKRS